jgi:uncharacterized membrane protein YkvA (DUF1232 family)
MKMIERGKKLFQHLILDGYLLYLILINPKTPWYSRLLMLLPVAYIFVPMDFVVDTIPILGLLDDLAVVRYGYPLLLKIVPKGVLEECRQRVQARLSLAGRKWFKTVAIILLIVVLLVVSGTIYLLIRWVVTS